MEYRYCPVCASELVMRHDSESGADGEKARLACPVGHWTHWDNPIPVLAALVEVENRILLARNAAWGPKNFALRHPSKASRASCMKKPVCKRAKLS
jgi:NAD+ diphosphatase